MAAQAGPGAVLPGGGHSTPVRGLGALIKALRHDTTEINIKEHLKSSIH